MFFILFRFDTGKIMVYFTFNIHFKTLEIKLLNYKSNIIPNNDMSIDKIEIVFKILKISLFPLYRWSQNCSVLAYNRFFKNRLSSGTAANNGGRRKGAKTSKSPASISMI